MLPSLRNRVVIFHFYFDIQNNIVDALVREEVNTIDTSDLFLDVFISDEFNQYGGLEEFEAFDTADATADPDGPVALSHSPVWMKHQHANRRIGPKTRFVR